MPGLRGLGAFRCLVGRRDGAGHEFGNGVGAEGTAVILVQAFRPVAGHHDFVGHVVLLEGVESQLHVVRVVFDKENCCLVLGSLSLL